MCGRFALPDEALAAYHLHIDRHAEVAQASTTLQRGTHNAQTHRLKTEDGMLKLNNTRLGGGSSPNGKGKTSRRR